MPNDDGVRPVGHCGDHELAPPVPDRPRVLDDGAIFVAKVSLLALRPNRNYPSWKRNPTTFTRISPLARPGSPKEGAARGERPRRVRGRGRLGPTVALPGSSRPPSITGQQLPAFLTDSSLAEGVKREPNGREERRLVETGRKAHGAAEASSGNRLLVGHGVPSIATCSPSKRAGVCQTSGARRGLDAGLPNVGRPSGACRIPLCDRSSGRRGRALTTAATSRLPGYHGSPYGACKRMGQEEHEADRNERHAVLRASSDTGSKRTRSSIFVGLPSQRAAGYFGALGFPASHT
jgi:hypothetical protein